MKTSAEKVCGDRPPGPRPTDARPQGIQVSALQKPSALSWTSEFPTVAGKFWFYGYRYKRNAHRDLPEMLLTNAGMAGSGGLIVFDGSDVMHSDACYGLWAPATLPAVPEAWAEYVKGLPKS